MADALPPLPHRGPLGFAIDGDEYHLPELSTRTWLDAFGYAMPASWSMLIPGQLAAQQQVRMRMRLSAPSDGLDVDQLEKHALTVLAAPLGVDFHVAQRLIIGVRSQWMLFDARCASYGLDPLDTHISRLCAIAYQLRLEACEKESERKSVQMRLWQPPDGTRASGARWEDDPDMSAKLDKLESDAFMSMFG